MADAIHETRAPELPSQVAVDRLDTAARADPGSSRREVTQQTHDLLQAEHREASGGEQETADDRFFLDRSKPVEVVDLPKRPDGEPVIAGHGYYYAGGGYTEIPEGTSVAFYTEHGNKISDSAGQTIESGTRESEPTQTLEAGDRVQNSMLAPGHGLTVSEHSIRAEPANHNATDDRPLSELLQPNMGRVHWAACREHLPFPL